MSSKIAARETTFLVDSVKRISIIGQQDCIHFWKVHHQSETFTLSAAIELEQNKDPNSLVPPVLYTFIQHWWLYLDQWREERASKFSDQTNTSREGTRPPSCCSCQVPLNAVMGELSCLPSYQALPLIINGLDSSVSVRRLTQEKPLSSVCVAQSCALSLYPNLCKEGSNILSVTNKTITSFKYCPKSFQWNG